jgi:hypothetical protein
MLLSWTRKTLRRPGGNGCPRGVRPNQSPPGLWAPEAEGDFLLFLGCSCVLMKLSEMIEPRDSMAVVLLGICTIPTISWQTDFKDYLPRKIVGVIDSTTLY